MSWSWNHILVWEHPYAVCTCFGGRAGSEVYTGCVFPQGVLAATILVEGRVGIGEASARARCNSGLLLCSGSVTALLGMGSGSEELKQEPWGNWVSPVCDGDLTSALVGDMAGAWGLGAALLCWFHFFPLVYMPWLEVGSRSEGLVPHHLPSVHRDTFLLVIFERLPVSYSLTKTECAVI